MFVFGFFFCLLIGVAAAAIAVWGYYYISRDLPKLSEVDNYKLPAVTQVYANDKNKKCRYDCPLQRIRQKSKRQTKY